MTPRSTSADHVFVCYARKDQEFVLKLAGNLKARGAPVWIDQWDIPPTADWDLTIDNALYDCAQFLIVLSPAAVGSREVRGELRTALDEDKPIVPVLYRECRVPRQLRLIQHLDFTGRGPDDEVALAQVLLALGVPKAPPSEPAQREPTSEPSQPKPIQVSLPEKPRITPDRQTFEPEMVLIPAGPFLMGSPDGDPDADGDEKPQHEIYLPDFYIDRTPVTNAQYRRFVEAGGYTQAEYWAEAADAGRWKDGAYIDYDGKPRAQPYFWEDARWNGDQQPVVGVSWYEALAYARWAGKRLPGEAEWEKAAGWDPAAGRKRRYPWGDEWREGRANTEEAGHKKTTPVENHPEGASPCGVLDMAGNVWEWCQTAYKDYPYDPDDGREELGGGDAVGRVLRGGSWGTDRTWARCACRDWDDPRSRCDGSGFRCCCATSSPAPGSES